MYENEYKTLLALIAPLCGGVKTEVEIGDYRTLCLLAKQHSVTNLLYLALKDDPALPSELRAALENLLFSSMRQQVAQEYEAERVFAALEEAGIRYLPLKGIVLRPLYPAPEMRISCDVDIYYDKAERARVGQILASLGFVSDFADVNHAVFTKGTVTIEMHHNLILHLPTIGAYYADLWSRLIPVSDYRYKMSDEDFYIYQILHDVKHFVDGGTGIRSVLDIFVYLRARPSLDKAYLERELERLGLLTFHHTLVRLAEAYFGGAALPAELQDVSDYILQGGTYGISSRTVVGKGGKLGFYLSHAFPSYTYMAEKYPSLRRFPPALPFYWGYRLCVAAFGKKHRLSSELQTAGAIDKNEQNRLKGIMDQVGLRDYR